MTANSAAHRSRTRHWLLHYKSQTAHALCRLMLRQYCTAHTSNSTWLILCGLLWHVPLVALSNRSAPHNTPPPLVPSCSCPLCVGGYQSQPHALTGTQSVCLLGLGSTPVKLSSMIASKPPSRKQGATQ